MAMTKLEELLSRFKPKEDRHQLSEANRQALEDAYGYRPEGDVLRVLELGGTTDYVGKPAMRYMGLKEILNAEAYLHVEFKSHGLLPLFDLHENDFVCYRLAEGNYVVINIIDLTPFSAAPTLVELLNKLGY